MVQPRSGEAAFRIATPNSIARDVLVIGLDQSGQQLIAGWNDETWPGVFFAAKGNESGPAESRWRDVLDERRFDVVILLGSLGCDFTEAQAIGARCARDNIKLGCILVSATNDRGDEGWHLGEIRSWVRTLSIVRNADLIPGMLHALGG